MPGGSGPLQVKIDNPNAFPLYLKSLDVIAAVQAPSNVLSATTGSDVGTLCPVGNWALEDLFGLSIEVVPGQSTINVPQAVTLDANAPVYGPSRACSATFDTA